VGVWVRVGVGRSGVEGRCGLKRRVEELVLKNEATIARAASLGSGGGEAA
jgi:hypothetical protein